MFCGEFSCAVCNVAEWYMYVMCVYTPVILCLCSSSRREGAGLWGRGDYDGLVALLTSNSWLLCFHWEHEYKHFKLFILAAGECSSFFLSDSHYVGDEALHSATVSVVKKRAAIIALRLLRGEGREFGDGARSRAGTATIAMQQLREREREGRDGLMVSSSVAAGIHAVWLQGFQQCGCRDPCSTNVGRTLILKHVEIFTAAYSTCTCCKPQSKQLQA